MFVRVMIVYRFQNEKNKQIINKFSGKKKKISFSAALKTSNAVKQRRTVPSAFTINPYVSVEVFSFAVVKTQPYVKGQPTLIIHGLSLVSQITGPFSCVCGFSFFFEDLSRIFHK